MKICWPKKLEVYLPNSFQLHFKCFKRFSDHRYQTDKKTSLMKTNSTIEVWTIFVEIKVANQYSILTKQNSKKKKKVFGKPKLTLINDKFHPLYRPPTYSNVTFPLSKVQTSNISDNCGQWQCGKKGAIMLLQNNSILANEMVMTNNVFD